MDNGDDLGTSISSYLFEIQRSLKAAVEAGLNEAAELTIRELEGASPKASGRYARSWIKAKAKDGGDYTGVRFIRNERRVGWKGSEIPLVVILENTSRKRPHIARAWGRVRGRVRAAIESAVEKALK